MNSNGCQLEYVSATSAEVQEVTTNSRSVTSGESTGRQPNTNVRRRTAFTPFQEAELKAEFAKCSSLFSCRRMQIAGKLGLCDRVVKVWFQNQRQKVKRERKACGTTSVASVTNVSPVTSLTPAPRKHHTLDDEESRLEIQEDHPQHDQQNIQQQTFNGQEQNIWLQQQDAIQEYPHHPQTPQTTYAQYQEPSLQQMSFHHNQDTNLLQPSVQPQLSEQFWYPAHPQQEPHSLQFAQNELAFHQHQAPYLYTRQQVQSQEDQHSMYEHQYNVPMFPPQSVYQAPQENIPELVNPHHHYSEQTDTLQQTSQPELDTYLNLEQEIEKYLANPSVDEENIDIGEFLQYMGVHPELGLLPAPEEKFPELALADFEF